MLPQKYALTPQMGNFAIILSSLFALLYASIGKRKGLSLSFEEEIDIESENNKELEKKMKDFSSILDDIEDYID